MLPHLQQYVPLLCLLVPIAVLGVISLLDRHSRSHRASRRTPTSATQPRQALPATGTALARFRRGEITLDVFLAHQIAERDGAPAGHRLNEDLRTTALPAVAVPAQRRAPNVRMVNTA